MPRRVPKTRSCSGSLRRWWSRIEESAEGVRVTWDSFEEDCGEVRVKTEVMAVAGRRW